MIRFLHAADLHLDSPLRGLQRYEGAPVDRLRGASRRALENLVQLAIDERVQFVLLAGDVYDGDWHDVGTGLYFVQQMAKLNDAKIPVFLIAGNHDAANVMSRSLPLPPNVRSFAHDQPESIPLANLGVVLHGQSYADRDEPNNLAIRYPAAVRNMVNIGLLHTALTGRDGHEPYAPCILEDLETRGYDYWALGHVHQRESVARNGHPLVEFPGNIQGRHIRETGAKGCLLVTATGPGKLTSEFRPLDVVRWHRIDVVCDEAVDRAAIFERVSAELADAVHDVEGRMLAARVELLGACSCHEALLAQSGVLRDELRALALTLGDGAVWIEKVHVRTRPIDEAASAEISEDALSEFAAVIADLRAKPEALQELLDIDDLKTLASRVPTELKTGADAVRIGDADWAAGLLDRARALLVDEATQTPGRKEASR